MRIRHLTAFGFVLCMGCGSDDDSESSSSSNLSGDDNTDSVMAGDVLGEDEVVIGGFDGDSNGGGSGAGSGGSGAASSGNEDTCDGLDNDGNGIIDDVDVGNDGICDCLRIATLGEAGEWGNGDIFETWLDTRSATGATDLGDATLTPDLLSGYQVVVVQNVSVIGREYADAEVTAFREWIESGGGAMTLIGYADPAERANVNRLLAPFDVQYGEEQILQKQGGVTVPVTNWNAHATTTGVEMIGVDNGYPVTGGAALLASEGGHDMARAADAGLGRVFVWGDEWITYDSEWNDRPEYQVELLWVNILKWLSPENECQVEVPPRLINMAR